MFLPAGVAHLAGHHLIFNTNMPILRERLLYIDGLRAVAVLAVLIFHMNPAWLPGGFVGVDIFFVISAYLITQIVSTEIDKGTFSFSKFYSRRIKRIFPASAVVFLVTVLIASQTNAYLLISAKFIPLLTYNMHVLGYFTADAQKNFFLHYWSLVIEEQFYLFWPISLLILSKLTLLTHRITPRSVMIAFCLLISIGSIGYTEWLINDPFEISGAYFDSFSRFGQLTIGAAIALISPKFTFNSITNKLFAIVGVIGIGISFALIEENGYPGIKSLVPTISSALILISCGRVSQNWFIARILTFSPLPLIGRMSYSLYLWHWPVLSITRFIQGTNELSNLTLVICVFVIAVLTVLSYKYVERPVIESNFSISKIFYTFASSSIILTSLTIAFSGLEEWNIKPIIGHEFANVTVDGQNAHLTEGWLAPCWERKFEDKSIKTIDSICHIGASTGPKVLLVGDSHAAAIGQFVDVIARKEIFNVTSYQVGACQLSEWNLAGRVPAFVRTAERENNCRDMLDYIKNNAKAYDAILVANGFNLFSGDFDVFSNKVVVPPKFALDSLTEIAKSTPLIFIYDEPVLDRSIQYSPLLNWIGMPIGATQIAGGNSGNRFITELVEQLPNSRWIDLSNEYETLSRNRFLYENRPVYVDTNHLSGYGGRVLADLFVQNGSCFMCANNSTGKKYLHNSLNNIY